MMDSDALDAAILRAGSQSCTCSGTTGQPRSDLTFSHSDTADMIRVHAVAMMMKSRGLATGDFLYSEEHFTGCQTCQECKKGWWVLGHSCRILHNLDEYSKCVLLLESQTVTHSC